MPKRLLVLIFFCVIRVAPCYASNPDRILIGWTYTVSVLFVREYPDTEDMARLKGRMVMPEYPEDYVRAGIVDDVFAIINVTDDGKVESVTTEDTAPSTLIDPEGHRVFQKSVMKALAQWRFEKRIKPATASAGAKSKLRLRCVIKFRRD